MAFTSLRPAKVIGVHPEAHSVDLQFLDDGSTVPGVQVMTGFASTNTGLNDLPSPSAAPAGRTGVEETQDRDIYAIVGAVMKTPVVLGFLFPQVCQMLFADVNRRVDRHASDVYSTIDKDGNFEWYHPSGTYLRIGTTPAHEDLTGQDFDQKWAITKNTDKAVYVHLSARNAGSEVASVDIDPSGNVTVQNDGNLDATVGGTTHLDSAGNVTVDAPLTTFTGPVTVQGLLTYQAGMVGHAISGDAATITGTVNVTSGDVTADGKSLKTHIHGGVEPGPGTTSVPL